MTRQGLPRDVRLFLILTLGASLFFWLILWSATETVAQHLGLFSHLLMWCPGVAALATRWRLARSFRGMGWRWPGLRWLLLAFLLPTAFALSYAALWASPGATLDHERLAAAATRFGMGALPSWLSLAILVLLVPAIGLLIDGVSVLGEELGWRGLLVPALVSRFGFSRASLLSGAIWAAWHIPLIVAFIPHLRPGSPPWVAAVFFAVTAISMSFVFTWFWLRTRSVWPAVVLHASTNLILQGLLDRLTLDAGPTRWLAGEHGAVVALTSLAIGFVFWRAGLRDKLDSLASPP